MGSAEGKRGRDAAIKQYLIIATFPKEAWFHSRRTRSSLSLPAAESTCKLNFDMLLKHVFVFASLQDVQTTLAWSGVA